MAYESVHSVSVLCNAGSVQFRCTLWSTCNSGWNGWIEMISDNYNLRQNANLVYNSLDVLLYVFKLQCMRRFLSLVKTLLTEFEMIHRKQGWSISIVYFIPGFLHWTRILQYSVPMHDIQILPGITVEECQDDCQAISDQCVSVDYSHDGTCFLNSASPLDELAYTPNVDVFTYCEMRTTNGEVSVIYRSSFQCNQNGERKVALTGEYIVYTLHYRMH